MCTSLYYYFRTVERWFLKCGLRHPARPQRYCRLAAEIREIVVEITHSSEYVQLDSLIYKTEFKLVIAG